MLRLLLNRFTQGAGDIAAKNAFRFYKPGHSPAELRDTIDPRIFTVLIY
jgi:hypothetical protein